MTFKDFGVEARTYIGVGEQIIKTSRGEVKAHSGDWILTFRDGSICVLPPLAYRMFLEDVTAFFNIGPVIVTVDRFGPQERPALVPLELKVEEKLPETKMSDLIFREVPYQPEEKELDEFGFPIK